jgi:hypothetical protein
MRFPPVVLSEIRAMPAQPSFDRPFTEQLPYFHPISKIISLPRPYPRVPYPKIGQMITEKPQGLPVKEMTVRIMFVIPIFQIMHGHPTTSTRLICSPANTQNAHALCQSAK